MDPRQVLEIRLETLSDAESDGDVHADDADAIRTFVDAYDDDNMLETPPGDDSALEPGTLATYVENLTHAARAFRITDADTDDANQWLQSVKDDGKAQTTINGRSTAIRTFFGWFRADRGGDAAPDPDDVARVEAEKATFDPDDVLDRDDVGAMLDAAGNPRDRAVVAVLAYTGMRNQCLRTLRVGDVDVDADGNGNGRWSPNGDAEGLKGMADRSNEKRPLLAATKPVREWLAYHPASDDPDAYLITGRPTYSTPDPSTPVAESTIRRAATKAADAAGIEKPSNPHKFRHAFVTIAKREYDMDDGEIRWLIGHAPGSRVMETTYSHLSDGDHCEKAEIAAGLRDPDDDGKTLTPQACTVCGEPLASSAKACPDCGAVFAPDAVAARKDGQQAVGDAASGDTPADLAQQLAAVASDDDDLREFGEKLQAMADGGD